MVDVLCIGHVAYDVTLPLKDYPLENSKYVIDYKIEGGGGPASNAAYLLSKWGIKTSFIGLLGDDTYGKNIIEEFKNVGTDISMVKMAKDYPTPYSTILVNIKNGTRTIINSKVQHPQLDIDQKHLEKLNPKVMLFDGHELKTSIKAMELFPNAKTILDAGSVREGTLVLGEKVDYLIVSENFALSYCKMESLKNENDYEECMNKIKQLNKHGQIVVTLGERGLIYEEKGRVKSLDAYKVKAVDTTGAGDIFHGAFAYGLINNYSLIENLKLSSKTSAISVQTLGGRRSIPDKDKII